MKKTRNRGSDFRAGKNRMSFFPPEMIQGRINIPRARDRAGGMKKTRNRVSGFCAEKGPRMSFFR